MKKYLCSACYASVFCHISYLTATINCYFSVEQRKRLVGTAKYKLVKSESSE